MMCFRGEVTKVLPSCEEVEGKAELGTTLVDLVKVASYIKVTHRRVGSPELVPFPKNLKLSIRMKIDTNVGPILASFAYLNLENKARHDFCDFDRHPGQVSRQQYGDSS